MREIVIKLDENVYTRLFDNGIELSAEDRQKIETAIRKGTVLPEKHGRIGDLDALTLADVHLIDGIFVCDAPAILEATESEE